MAAGVMLITTIFFGGFQTGWTGYSAAGDQGTAGYDAYIGFFALVGVSMCLLGFNLIVTIITMRAPGMTWSRLPIFVWACWPPPSLMMLAAPMLIAALLMGAMDRTVQTAFFIPGNGGSAYLYQNLFWVFGHPEVYIVALPGFGIVLELLPVFSRKPLWGYRLAVAGMLGVALLSFFVWQHHLFVAGINADLRPFYMLSTELISLPTGFIFLCGHGHAVARANTVHRADAVLPGLGVQLPVRRDLGVFLSDVPSDVTTHGSFFSMAHFHYTIMGGLVFTLFAAIYYWGPKMVGFKFNERLAKIHFWSLFIAFNCTFAPLFALGLMGMPRRVVTYPVDLQPLNDLGVCVGVHDRAVDARVPRQPGLVLRVPARAGPGQPVGLQVGWSGSCPRRSRCTTSTASPSIDADPYPYGVESIPAGAPAAVGGLEWKPQHHTHLISRPSRSSGSPASCGPAPGCWRGRWRSSSPRSCSRISICACSTPTTAGSSAMSCGRPAGASRS